ncbi:hypothetical protein [Tannerella forsythia]|uniref:Uncharacterized protein n=1 Tax=Tannerella forsythia TaxID=28112 RepID=A0A3P1YWE4_TANFO|nr:hypothetical protein [Tannerella forsythia]RRD75259.1 hypothetical protein EII41_07035 [Tannerella forsythia]
MKGKEFEVNVQLEQTLGMNGKSAYEIWLEAGNEGTVEDFLNALKWNQGKHRITIDLVPNWPAARRFLLGENVQIQVEEEVTNIAYQGNPITVNVKPGKTVRIIPPVVSRFAAPKTHEFVAQANAEDTINIAYDTTLVLCTVARTVRPRRTEPDDAAIPVVVECGSITDRVECGEAPAMIYLPRHAEAIFTPEASAGYTEGVKTLQTSDDLVFVALKQKAAWVYFKPWTGGINDATMEQVFIKITNADTSVVIHEHLPLSSVNSEELAIPVPAAVNLRIEFEVPYGVLPVEAQTVESLSAGSANEITVSLTGGLVEIFAPGLDGEADFDILYAEGEKEGQVLRSGTLSGYKTAFMFVDLVNFKIRFKPSKSGLNPSPEEAIANRKTAYEYFSVYISYS